MTTRIFQLIDSFIKKMNGTDMVLFKIGSIAFGVFIGAAVSGNSRKAVKNIGLITFIASVIPLAWKFYGVYKSSETVVISDETNI